MKNLLTIIIFFFPVWTIAQPSPTAPVQPNPAAPNQPNPAAPVRPNPSNPIPNRAPTAAGYLTQTDSTLTEALHFVDSILSHTDLTYDLSEPDFPPDLQSILIRFNNAIAANKEWFLDYRSKSGTPLPYNERFGITYAEYQRIQNLEKLPPHFTTIQQQPITVIRDNGHIRFKGAGDARLLDYFEINLSQRQILFAGDTLVFIGAMTPGQLQPLGLAKGYTWRLQKADLKNSLQTGKATARVVEINLGLPSQKSTTAPASPNANTPANSSTTTTPNNTSSTPTRTLLHIKYQDMLEGALRTDLDVFGFLH